MMPYLECQVMHYVGILTFGFIIIHVHCTCYDVCTSNVICFKLVFLDMYMYGNSVCLDDHSSATIIIALSNLPDSGCTV